MAKSASQKQEKASGSTDLDKDWQHKSPELSKRRDQTLLLSKLGKLVCQRKQKYKPFTKAEVGKSSCHVRNVPSKENPKAVCREDQTT